MSTTNTKIWFLLLAAGALFCPGCATTTSEPSPIVKAQVLAAALEKRQ